VLIPKIDAAVPPAHRSCHIWCKLKRKATVSKKEGDKLKREGDKFKKEGDRLKRKVINPVATPADLYVMSLRHSPVHLCSTN
jgi:hypothetical protein